jgi:acyl-CoA synthetase (AMP-forming)/AMP-acid ligase II
MTGLAMNKTQLVNMYGPTECTDIATAFTITDKTQLKFYLDNPLPLGKASGGVELYIVDAEQKQLPDGLIGELCFGGAGVGLGYLNAISTYLCQHPDVVDAACVLQSQQLVAFYQGASHLSSDTLNQFVAPQLPH